ncbi:MAG: Fe-S oxidoreductase, partial [Bacteroidaceae bacterium]|nr:Fe-S oxidoreductase [Bacteroidaceae bacterium]
KLDTISPDYITLIDRPNGNYDVQKIIEGLKKFGNRCVIQTMFMKGEYEGKSADNTSEAFVQPWLQTVQAIQPREVMIYTIDRETPAHQLKKASPEELDAIGEQVRQSGIACSVAY